MTFFYKSGSSSTVTLVGNVSSLKNVTSKDGRPFTCLTILTRESFTGKDGSRKSSEAFVPVFIEGEVNCATGNIVAVTADLSLAVVSPKSETQKWDITQETLRNPHLQVLAAAGHAEADGINDATLMGRVGSVRQLKSASSAGVAMSLAVSRSEKKGDGYDTVTDWHEVTFWGKKAESLGKIGIGKGDLLFVKGRVATRTAKVNGTERNLLAFMASDFNLLNKKSASAPDKAPASTGTEKTSGKEEEVPFF